MARSNDDLRCCRLMVIANRLPHDGYDGGDSVLLETLEHLIDRGCELCFLSLRHDFGWPWRVLPRALRRAKRVIAPRNIQMGSALLRTSPLVWGAYVEGAVSRRLPSALRKATDAARPLRRLAQCKAQSPIKSFTDAPTDDDAQLVRNAITLFRPTAMMVDFSWLTPLFAQVEQIGGATKIVYGHDLMSLRVQTFLRAGIKPGLPVWALDDEINLFENADAVILETRAETAIVRDRLPGLRVLRLPRGARFRGTGAVREKHRLLFVAGNATHNVTGIRWFIGQVLPLLRNAEPDITLEVVGAVCEQFAATTEPGVVWRGRIDDLSEAYRTATCVIVPLLAGTGFKTKLAEALSYGCATVATSCGAWGAEELADRAVIIADEPQRFAEGVLRILRDDLFRGAMEREAERYTRQELDPDVLLEPLLDILKNGPNQRRKSGAPIQRLPAGDRWDAAGSIAAGPPVT